MLTVIIVVFNRLDYTKRTIDSLIRSLGLGKFNLFIYDNNSTEVGMKEYLEGLHQVFPKLTYRLALGNENVGWGKALNYVLRAKEYTPWEGWNTEYFLLSNNDVEYADGWYEKLLELYDKYPLVGIMGVWKHTAHHKTADHGDLIEKDNMPAVGWLLKKSFIDEMGPFPENGPCLTRGGNGEDTTYVGRAIAKRFWIAAPKEDVAVHIDGY